MRSWEHTSVEATEARAKLTLDSSSTAQQAAERAADVIAASIAGAIDIKGFAAIAVSGGSTPSLMFDALAAMDIDWQHVHLFQVDERMVPSDSADRNFAELERRLIARISIPADQVHPLPVPTFLDPAGLTIAASHASATLKRVCGATLDLVHLGLGDDGHTASLVPDDRALRVEGSDVTWTAPYRGHSRLTLTFSALNRARQVLWLACGESKQQPLALLLSKDPSIPASHVRSASQVAFVDAAASLSAGSPT